MADITESAVWEEGIYQYEEEDLVQGGADGIDNVQGKQLANRTLYLKGLVEGLGLNKQDASVLLAAIASLVGAADKLAYFTGANSAAMTAFTAFARTLLAAADAAAARAVLGAASPADIASAVAALVNSSPAALDTLNEFAAALGNDANFATTITNALALKASQGGIQSQTYTAFTTAGAAPNFTLTPNPAITAYVAGQRFRVKFNAIGNGLDVLNVSGLGNKSLKQYDATGAKVPPIIAANQLTDVEYDGVDFVLLDQAPLQRGISRFDASGTFTVPSWVSTVYVSGCGGGGGGGAYASAGSGAGGGGGGASCLKRAVTVTSGAAITVTIGTGGAGGAVINTAGTAGGSTSFGALLTLGGGGGGIPAGGGGAGGAASGGSGGPAPGGTAGEQYNKSTGVASGGSGGGCIYGSGGVGGGSASTSLPGIGMGAGGGGGAAGIGASGTAGFLIVEW